MQAFKTGDLLLEAVPSGAGEICVQAGSLSMGILVALFVVLSIALMRSFLQLVPYIADSFLRARGSVVLESSVRVSRDRDAVALVMLLPMTVLTCRYRLYNPSFLAGASPDSRLWLTAAAISAYLLLRLLMYVLLKPKRRYEQFQTAHHATYTFFILLVLLLMGTAGIMYVFGASDASVRLVLYTEIMVVYLVFLFRRAQILSLSCNQLRTFLYLCGLEILPTAALVVSAVLL